MLFFDLGEGHALFAQDEVVVDCAGVGHLFDEVAAAHAVNDEVHNIGVFVLCA